MKPIATRSKRSVAASSVAKPAAATGKRSWVRTVARNCNAFPASRRGTEAAAPESRASRSRSGMRAATPAFSRRAGFNSGRVAQLHAQACDRLGMNLAHAGLAHAEHFADFAQVHLLLVIHAHHLLLALGERIDAGDQRLAKAAFLEDFEGIPVVPGRVTLEERILF